MWILVINDAVGGGAGDGGGSSSSSDVIKEAIKITEGTIYGDCEEKKKNYEVGCKIGDSERGRCGGSDRDGDLEEKVAGIWDT